MKIFFNKHSAAIILIITASSFLFYGISSGITGRTKKNGVGCTCHNPNPSSNVTVTINGPDALQPGETALYSVTIKGGPLIRGGTNISVSDGSLASISSDLKLEFNNELTHAAPKEPEGEAVIFNFNYTAPESPGIQTLYANGNSVNFNGFNDGDQWNFAPNKTINVLATTSIEKEIFISSYKLQQNFPNPFNPTTEIRFSIAKAGLVNLTVYNILGLKAATLINKFMNTGNHSVKFFAGNFASGVYFYRLEAGDYVSNKKMILLK